MLPMLLRVMVVVVMVVMLEVVVVEVAVVVVVLVLVLLVVVVVLVVVIVLLLFLLLFAVLACIHYTVETCRCVHRCTFQLFIRGRLFQCLFAFFTYLSMRYPAYKWRMPSV